MFTKEEFDLAKKLYCPLKVVELCKEHGIKIEFKVLGKEHVFFMFKGGLVAGMRISGWCNKDEEILYGIKRGISHLEWEIENRKGGKKCL